MIVPDVGRVAIKNVFSNAASPVSIFSSIAQGEVEKSATALGRLLINTTLGLGGIFDVADEFYGIKPVSEDFDHALGSYGVPTGPYLVLPVFGPSTMRHVFGRILDTMANPTTYFAPFVANVSAGAGDRVNTFSFDPELKKDLDQSAVDPYESMRYFYYQRRGAVAEK
jgi:phospholipid-binding lipoprotein MlaA